jgi:hypothetical protein
MPPALSWTPAEDASLRALVARHGPKRWSAIAAELGGKNPKQCRRRWRNALAIDAKATTWTPAEDAALQRYQRELGNRWTEIGERFGDRTDNACKNRWHALAKRGPGGASGEDGSAASAAAASRRRAASSSAPSAPPPPAPDPKRRRLLAPLQRSGTLPTPFDQPAAPAPPLSLLVERGSLSAEDAALAEQVNSLRGFPLHIEVTPLPSSGVMLPLAGGSGAWVPGPGGGSWRLSAGGGAHSSLAEVIGWLNATATGSMPVPEVAPEAAPARRTRGGAAAAQQQQQPARAGGAGAPAPAPAGAGAAGVGAAAAGLNTEQRDFLSRLFARARTGTADAFALGGGASGGLGGSGGLAAALAGPPLLGSAPSLGLLSGRGLSPPPLGRGSGSGGFLGSGGRRVSSGLVLGARCSGSGGLAAPAARLDPLGRTRSASSGGAAALPRTSSRERRAGAPLAAAPPLASAPLDIAMLPSLSLGEIDMVLEALGQAR